MEEFIHQQNLALFKKLLAEPHTDAEREVLLKLLADEEANEPRPMQDREVGRSRDQEAKSESIFVLSGNNCSAPFGRVGNNLQLH